MVETVTENRVSLKRDECLTRIDISEVEDLCNAVDQVHTC